jgi:hypothetical protein
MMLRVDGETVPSVTPPPTAFQDAAIENRAETAGVLSLRLAFRLLLRFPHERSGTEKAAPSRDPGGARRQHGGGGDGRLRVVLQEPDRRRGEFSDGVTNELATVSGSAASGYTAMLNVGVQI